MGTKQISECPRAAVVVLDRLSATGYCRRHPFLSSSRALFLCHPAADRGLLPGACSVTALCPVSCLFTTMLGNKTTGVPGLSKQEVIAPFVHAFDDPEKGGCPDP